MFLKVDNVGAEQTSEMYWPTTNVKLLCNRTHHMCVSWMLRMVLDRPVGQTCNLSITSPSDTL